MRRSFSPPRLSARQAVRAIPPTARGIFTPACGMPQTLLAAIAEEAGRFQALDLYAGIIFADSPLWQRLGENIRLTSWHVTGHIQKQIDSGLAQYLPMRMSHIPRTFAPGGPLAVDVALIQVTPPDDRGYVSLGATVHAIVDPARNAPLVIAEVNPQAPRTLGNCLLHVDEIDYLVDADYPLIQHRPGAEIGATEQAIAAHAASLIPDGATIQIGLGAIPEALLFLLKDKRDLGVHSGMISDGIVALAERGVITGARKTIDRGKIVAGECMGGPDLYRWAHQNPMLHMDSSAYIHDPDIIREIECFVSINSAVEIDLTGQVNSETVNGRQISGIGGQLDFVEGALAARGGISIFAMPATAAKGKLSRIVGKLSPAAAVSTPRTCSDYVVTEYGIASLRGKTLAQRAGALTAIAHPSFRDALAKEMGRA